MKTQIKYATMETTELPWEEPWSDGDEITVGIEKALEWGEGAPMIRGILKLGEMEVLTGWQISYLSQCIAAEDFGETELPHYPPGRELEVEDLRNLRILTPPAGELVADPPAWNWNLVRVSKQMTPAQRTELVIAQIAADLKGAGR